jgi:transitional endoplasmic reticulum ATPase
MNAPFKIVRGGAQERVAAEAQNISLTPTQARALADLKTFCEVSPVVLLSGAPGLGKTTILAQFAQESGAQTVTISDIARVIAPLEGGNYDAPLYLWLRERLRASQILILDGIANFLARALDERVYYQMFMILEMLYRDAQELDRTLIVSGFMPSPDWSAHHLFRRADLPFVEMESLMHEDYAAILNAHIPEGRAQGIRVEEMFRFAALLNGHDLVNIARILSPLPKPTTQDALDAIHDFLASANTNTADVEAVSFETMPGMESIAAALETHIVTPLTDLALAQELDLKAKRGVLLYGPPGTGKTSVGRALAHRLKGRFFLIDGSVRTEPAYVFLEQVKAIVHEAIENAPSVIFIDDADVLFDVGHVAGLTRYLLTLMDGLTSANASKVCVMMTAMDAGKIPQAILRSGRVELWLQTKLPDAQGRAAILERWLGDATPALRDVDYRHLAGLTPGFTPADLRRVIGDAKALYASDRVRERPIASGTAYVERAVADIVASRSAMATNLADPTLRVG